MYCNKEDCVGYCYWCLPRTRKENETPNCNKEDCVGYCYWCLPRKKD